MEVIMNRFITSLYIIFPMVLTCIGILFDLSGILVTFLSGFGGIVALLMNRNQNSISHQHKTMQQLNKTLESDSESVPMISLSEHENILKSANDKIRELENRLSGYSEPKENHAYDVATDRRLGGWVQQFLIYVSKNSDNRRLYNLADQLEDVLACMGIRVYDEVRLNEKGEPDVPIRDYLIDSRQGKEYMRVLRPAVYSDKAVLARGEIE